MKKMILSMILTSFFINLVGCNKLEDANNGYGRQVVSNINFNSIGDIINITEDMYLTWVNEIYVNTDDYIGKKIKIEGMYSSYFIEEEDTTYNLVYRVGPGCCGDDGDMCGFEFESDEALPNENEWIEVEGTLGYYEVLGEKYLTIRDAKFTIKEERGSESVYN
ncbi:MAG: TIGR03943 family putative permease subunit [Peptostreptococcaceae bacterium]